MHRPIIYQGGMGVILELLSSAKLKSRHSANFVTISHRHHERNDNGSANQNIQFNIRFQCQRTLNSFLLNVPGT